VAGGGRLGSTVLTYEDIPREFNVTSYFLDRNLEEGGGDRTALICGDRRWSYRELAAFTNRIGSALREVGVRPEERVLLALSDGPEFVASWYAALKVGAVVAEVYTFLQPKDYAYYLDYSRARVVVADTTTLGAIREIRRSCHWLEHVLVAGEHDELREGELDLGELAAKAGGELEAAPTTKDDIAIWKFTTGSTGAPKAAVHCHHDPLISFDWYARGVLGYAEDDVVLPVPKLFFGYARDATTLFSFGVGGAGVVFPERSTPERLFELISTHRPTVLVQVPTMMNAMASHPEAQAHDLSSVRLCISSGEALPAELYRKWIDAFGIEVLDAVGSSEAYHVYLSSRPGRVRPGSVGELVPGYAARLLDAEGAEVPPGEPGELWLTGESTALMYWNDHEKSKRTFAGDTVRTGDLFEQDADGYFWYRGRADDLLKVGGIWVAPLEIERALLEHPAVHECAVVGYDDGGLVLPRAYVVPTAGSETGAELGEALKLFVRERLSPHKYPRDVRFLEDLPKTASGKLDRKALRTATPPGSAVTAAAVTSSELVRERERG
jgi:benzoate-CoA ligase family protein